MLRSVSKKFGKRIFSLLLCAAVLCMTLGANFTVAAEAEELIFDVGISENSVKAVLSDDGLLTLSGAGETKDYTAKAPPFAGVEDRITRVKIGGGVVSLGDYFFYNCRNLTGTLELPAGLIRLGTQAFSGETEALAPRPDLVISRFTQALISKDREESPSPSPLASPSPQSSGSPRPSLPPSSGESESPESSQPGEEEPESSPAAEEGAEPSSCVSGEEEKEENSSAPGGPEAAPGFLAVRRLAAGEEPEEVQSAPAEAVPKATPAAAETPEPQATPAPTALPKPSVTPGAAETPGPQVTPAPEESGKPTPSQAPGSSASPSPQTSAAPAPGATPEGEYEVVKLTELQMGEAVFFPVEAGEAAPVFYGEETNLSFLSAMAAAGYRRAQRLEEAVFDCGEGKSAGEAQLKKTLPVVEGKAVLPQAPREFSAPERGELFSYQFGGWTESRDEANTVRSPGSAFQADELTDLYFVACWEKEVLLKIKMVRRGEAAVFSVPSAEGWELTSFCWQQCILPPGQAVPKNEELLSWEPIEAATEQEYTRQLQPGDENRLFRCVVTAARQGFFRSLFRSPGEELALSSVRGISPSEYALSCSPGTYSGAAISGTMESITKEEGEYYVIPPCEYTAAGVDNLVFNGWSGSDGNTYDPGQIVRLTTPLSLTAQWALATVVYVNPEANGQDASGAKSNPCKYFQTVETGALFWKKTYPGVYSKLSASGTKYTNIIVLSGNVSLGSEHYTTGATPATITCLAPGETQGSFELSISGTPGIGAATIFRDITINGTTDTDHGQTTRLSGKGHQLIFGENVTTKNNVAVDGGGGSQNTQLILQSGEYADAYGAALMNESLSGGAQLMISGNAMVRVAVGGTWYGGSVTGAGPNGYGTEVLVGGNAFVGVIGAGGRDANSASTTKKTHVAIFENAVVAQPADDSSPDSVSRGYVSGSGLDAVDSNNGGCARGGTFIEVRENARVEGGVFGGSGDAYTANTGAAYQAYYSTVGDTEVVMTGGTISALYGAGNNRSTNGSATLRISGGTVTGNVCAAGSKGNLSGKTTVEISGGSIGGNVYGGGIQGAVSGGVEMKITGGTVAGSVYGGGSQGEVGQDVNLTLSGGNIAGSAYGGGYEGKVAGSSTVTMANGAVGGGLYGGGQSGAVGGSTATTFSGGTVQENIFGGSKGVSGNVETGLVSGSSTVEISGGVIGSRDGDGLLVAATGNVVAGGEYARLGGLAKVTIKAPDDQAGYPAVGDSVYGGGYYAPVQSSQVFLESGVVGGHVYGAGFGSAEATTSSASVTMTGGTVKANVYGGGRLGVTQNAVNVTISGGNVQGNVFGAGSGRALSAGDAPTLESGCVYGTATLTIDGGTVGGDVFGGGDYGCVGFGTLSGSSREITADVTQSSHTEVYLNGGVVTGNVFGGGSGSGSDAEYGTVFGDTQVRVAGGSVGQSVFGGSNRSYVTGGTFLEITGRQGAVTIGDTIFGGGNLSDGSDPTFNESTFLVLGDTSISLDGAQNKVLLGGSIFGSGNLTLVKGSSAIEIKHFEGTMQSIQRTDTASVIASSLDLEGANDVTEAVTRYYSVSKVDDLRLVDGSTVNLNKEVRELGALGNYVTEGAALAVSSQETARSTLQIYQGRIIQIKKNDVFGDVSGVLWLDIRTDGTAEDHGVSIQASLDTAIGGGTEATGTGAFVKKTTEASAELNFVSGEVAGSHHFWKLGSAVSEIDLTIHAIHRKNGGTGTVTQSFELPTGSTSTFYRVEGMSKLSGDFKLLLPAGGASVAGEGSYALGMEAVPGPAWASTGDKAHFLTSLPAGETAWNSGVPGVWEDGPNHPTTSSGTAGGSNGSAAFTLEYAPSYQKFFGGVVKITLREYLLGQPPTPETLEDTVVINLTLEGDEGESDGSQAYTAPGRRFAELRTTDAALTYNGAVSAQFITEYYPQAAGAEEMEITLYRLSGGTGQAVSFPAGAKAVLADMSKAEDCQYYLLRTGESPTLRLADFAGMGGNSSAHYPGPGSGVTKITEKLLLVLDFSGVSGTPLSPGNYALHLSHEEADNTAENAIATGAKFQITTSTAPSLTMELQSDGQRAFAVTLATSADASDTRYADGVGLRLALRDDTGAVRHIPTNTGITGELEHMIWDASGEISFSLPKTGTTRFTLDFSAVSGEELPGGSYTLEAMLWPKLGLQICSNGGTPDAVTSRIPITLANQTKEPVRGILASVSTSGERLLDVSQEDGEMNFTLQVEKQSGDSVTAVVYEKTGTAPESASYEELAGGASWCRVNGGTAKVTVPRGTKSGTYRVTFQVKNESGTVVAEDPFNFIVK